MQSLVQIRYRVSKMTCLNSEKCALVLHDRPACYIIQEFTEGAYSMQFYGFENERNTAKMLLQEILQKIVANASLFACHEFANYVVQYVISSDYHVEARELIIQTAVL